MNLGHPTHPALAPHVATDGRFLVFERESEDLDGFSDTLVDESMKRRCGKT